MCDVPSIAVFCSESIECFPGTASKFFFRLLLLLLLLLIAFVSWYKLTVATGRERQLIPGLLTMVASRTVSSDVLHAKLIWFLTLDVYGPQ